MFSFASQEWVLQKAAMTYFALGDFPTVEVEVLPWHLVEELCHQMPSLQPEPGCACHGLGWLAFGKADVSHEKNLKVGWVI